VISAGGVEPRDTAALDDDKPTADMQGGRPGHLALVAKTELGRSSADVDVENARALIEARPRGA